MTACQPFWQEEAPPNLIPVIQIDSPASNARISVGEEIEIKSTANDESFVQRVELYVDGELVQKDLPPIANGQKTFTVLQRWLPDKPQTVELRVVAYDNEGAASHPAAILIDILGEPAPLAVIHPTTVAIPTEVTIANKEPTAIPEPLPTEISIVESEPPPVVPDAPLTDSAPALENFAVPLITPTEVAPTAIIPEPNEPISQTAITEATEFISPTIAVDPTVIILPTAAPAAPTVPAAEPTAVSNNMPAAAAIPVVEGRLIATLPLNIYNAPNSQEEAIGMLNPNDVVIGIARNIDGDWIKIVYGADNREGWVFMTEFDWRGDIQALAIQ